MWESVLGQDTSENLTSEKHQGGKQRAQTCTPVNIRQLRMSKDEGIRIGSLNFYFFKVVAMVRQIEVLPAKVKYTLDDCSGTIVGIFWRVTETGELSSVPPIVVNTYCRVYGTLRESSSSKYLFVHKITALKQLGEVSEHILEVIHAALKVKAIDAGIITSSMSYSCAFNRMERPSSATEPTGSVAEDGRSMRLKALQQRNE